VGNRGRKEGRGHGFKRGTELRTGEDAKKEGGSHKRNPGFKQNDRLEGSGPGIGKKVARGWGEKGEGRRVKNIAEKGGGTADLQDRGRGGLA